jgi:hypothetical protein
MKTFQAVPFDELAVQCIEDMKAAAHTRTLTLQAQVRAYDLLDMILSEACSAEALKAWEPKFQEVYSSSLDEIFDEEVLQEEALLFQKEYESALTEARFKAASAESLHLYAKDIFGIWQNSGVFARRRALKDLRKRAGFKLESHRIGNYMAKTYDLMEAARRDFQKARQECFAANVSYKIKPGIYTAIAENLKNIKI